MPQSVSPRTGASLTPHRTNQKTARVMPLWEAAKTQRLRCLAHDAGAIG